MQTHEHMAYATLPEGIEDSREMPCNRSLRGCTLRVADVPWRLIKMEAPGLTPHSHKPVGHVRAVRERLGVLAQLDQFNAIRDILESEGRTPAQGALTSDQMAEIDTRLTALDE